MGPLRKTAASALALGACLAGGGARAAHYLPATPLASVVTSGARDCPAQASWRMPIITWGADETTLAANGGALATKPDSALGRRGLDLRLKRVDDFTDQLRAYLDCDSPFLRATLGMVAQAADVTEADPRTRGVTIYQHSWSAGGDVMVARADVRQPADLKGRTIVLQQDGPHVDYLLRILRDAGLKASDVDLRFVKDLTGKGPETPAAAMLSDAGVGAVMVISPDAATLTSGAGNVGTGAEGSARGAHAILSTRSANRVITDVIVVRRDFYEANKDRLSAFGKAMYDTEDRLKAAFAGKTPEWSALMKASASVLLDDAGATDDAQGLWTDAETSDRQGNARFFADLNYPRSFDNVAREVSAALREAGLTRGMHRLASADWDWRAQTSVADVAAPAAPRFSGNGAINAVTDINRSGRQGDATLYDFPIYFAVNQKDFPRSSYEADFDKVIDLANTYAGAVVTVEGHADPQAYLDKTAQVSSSPSAANDVLLKRMALAGKNLSVQRARQVVDSVIEAAKAKGVTLDASQFAVIGMGYDQPATGMCGALPCRPKNEREAASNRVVDFRIVNVEAETDAYAAQK